MLSTSTDSVSDRACHGCILTKANMCRGTQERPAWRLECAPTVAPTGMEPGGSGKQGRVSCSGAPKSRARNRMQGPAGAWGVEVGVALAECAPSVACALIRRLQSPRKPSLPPLGESPSLPRGRCSGIRSSAGHPVQRWRRRRRRQRHHLGRGLRLRGRRCAFRRWVSGIPSLAGRPRGWRERHRFCSICRPGVASRSSPRPPRWVPRFPCVSLNWVGSHV